MDIELRSHNGWTIYSIPGALSLEDAAYQAVRTTHKFLTDTNHTYQAGQYHSCWGGQDIYWRSVKVFRGEGTPAYSGPALLETD